MRHFLPISILLLLTSCQTGLKTAEHTKPFTNVTACIFSQLSYCKNPQEQISKYLPDWKIVWDATALNGNHAFVATDDYNYVVAIRGSLMELSWDAFENWVRQDLNIISQEPWQYSDMKDAKISTGAYRGWNNLVKLKDKSNGKDILTFLKEKTDKNDPIYFTGHSLGGNLASVIASYIAAEFKKEGRVQSTMNVITFAAPAAGNVDFADDFDKKFPQAVRFENKGDIIPKFPCKSAIIGLGKLYSDSLSASAISVGYQNFTVSLTSFFKTVGGTLTVMEFTNGLSGFKQTCGDGTPVAVNLSGKNNSNNIVAWFAEASYQHGIAQYATALGAPVVQECK